MKTRILLRGWGRRGKGSASFKNKHLGFLVEEFFQRISHFSSIEIVFVDDLRDFPAPQRELWICERAKKGTRVLSSEDLAVRLQGVTNRGMNLDIVIGGPDGISQEEISKAGLCWSFGPMTLTHEMAVLIASEQVYRAWTIIKGFPYHSNH